MTEYTEKNKNKTSDIAQSAQITMNKFQTRQSDRFSI